MDVLLDAALTPLVLLAIYGLGCALRRLVRLDFWGRAAEAAFRLAFGLGAAATLLFGFALVGLLVPAVGWGLLLIGLGLAGWHYRQLVADVKLLLSAIRILAGASWFVKGAVGLALAFALMNFEADLAPPNEGDTVHQYLLTVRYWVEAGRYVQPSHIWASTLPGHLMMLSAWALLLRPSYSLASLVTGFGMSLCLALAVYALARLHVGRTGSLLAAIAVYTMPDAGYLAQSAKVDMGWALFETLALAAFFRWRQAEDSAEPRPLSWLALAGVMLGLAAESKNQTAISLLLLGGWLVIRKASTGDGRGLLRAGAILAATALIALLPYYLYNAIAHRNPMYPVFADQFAAWFGGTPSPRSELGTEVFYPWTVGGYLTNLWNASLGHPPGFYLGFIAGPVFLLAIPAGAITGLLNRQRNLHKSLLYAFVFSIIWFLVKQAARHFLPGLALLGVVAGYVLARIDRERGWPRAAILAATLLCIGWNLTGELGVLYWSGAYRVGLGLETRDEFLRRWHDQVIGPTFPDWATITLLNQQVGAGGRVLTNHATGSLYIAPDMVSDNWGDRLPYDTVHDTEELLRLLDLHGIEYILIYKAGSSRDVIYDDPAFLNQHARLVAETGRARLYRIDN